MATIQTFYLHINGTPSSGLVRPSGYFGSSFWDQSNAKSGASAASMDGSAGSAQVSIAKSNWSAIAAAGTQNLVFAQFLSPALAGQSVGAASWTFAWAYTVSNASGMLQWSPYCGLYLVNGATGANRTTILSPTNPSSNWYRTSTGETSCYVSYGCSAFSPVAGDYLALEVAVQCKNTSASSWTPNTTLYADGTTALTVDNVGCADARSLITAPVALTLQATSPTFIFHPSASGMSSADPLD